MRNRDDFLVRTKKWIAQLSGFRCSNPQCRAMTVGSNPDGTKPVNIGVIAHISAASPKGPRYCAQMTAEERKSADNGVLLCENCSKLVDSNPDFYTSEKLRLWRKEAIESAKISVVPAAKEGKALRFLACVRQMVQRGLQTYQTEGSVKKDVSVRSAAGIFYRLLFEQMPGKTYEEQMELWHSAVDEISFQCLMPQPVRTASYERTFPRQYKELMTELETYGLCLEEKKDEIIDCIEEILEKEIASGTIFGIDRSQEM